MFLVFIAAVVSAFGAGGPHCGPTPAATFAGVPEGLEAGPTNTGPPHWQALPSIPAKAWNGDLRVAPDGSVYVSYYSGPAIVERWDGVSWTQVGTTASCGQSWQNFLFFDRRSNIYLCSRDYDTPGSLNVHRKLTRYIDGLPDRITTRLAKIGLLKPRRQQHSRQLTAALADFERYLAAKGDTPEHARRQANRARRVLVGECRFQLISSVAAEPVLLALAKLREPQVREGRVKPGLKATTSNSIRQACRSFTRWAAREGRLPEDPLLYLDRVEAEPDANRRALTSQEQARLVAVTKCQRRRGGLSGSSRAMLYTLALQTGLRRGELLSLRRSDFELVGEMPVVVIEHGRTKNRKRARLPLRPETAAALRQSLRDRLPAARVFRVSPNYRAAEILAKDLEAAGIEREAEGGVVDFHSLRVAFVSSLALAGVSLAQAQKLARHSTPMLTASVYSRFAPDEDVAAIAKLPSLADAVG